MRNRYFPLLVLFVLSGVSSFAWSQDEIVSSQAPAAGEGEFQIGEAKDSPAHKPGEGFFWNNFRVTPALSLDVYVNNNVFRTAANDSPDATTEQAASGVARLFGKVSATRGGNKGQNLTLFELGLGYNQYISGDATVRNLSGLDAALLGRYEYQPKGKFSLILEDNFQRMTSPRTIRIGSELLSPTFRQDTNRILLATRIRPQGGVLEQQFAYTGTLSVFETAEFATANHFKHDLSTYTKWNFFPKTAALFEVHLAYNDFFRDAQQDEFGNVDSLPIRATLGALGIIRNRIQFRADIGYGNSFHQVANVPDRGASFSGVIGRLQFRANIADRDILSLGYSHDFADSLFGNFILRDQVNASWTHAFTRQFQGSATLQMSLDRYSDIPPLLDQEPLQNNRTDFPLTLGVKGEYLFRKDLKLGANLSLISNFSNFQVRDLISGGINDANYFQVLAGVQATYTY